MIKPVEKCRSKDLVLGIILTTIIVVILGYLDHLTGEISLDVFYMFCVLEVTWFTNGYLGTLSIMEITLAKAMADYYDKVDIASNLYCWNGLNSILINVIVCLLATKLKKKLSK